MNDVNESAGDIYGVFCLFRILSDWLETKFGGLEMSKVRKEQPDDAMQTLCVIDTLQESGHLTHKVHISVKVRSRCSTLKHFRKALSVLVNVLLHCLSRHHVAP